MAIPVGVGVFLWSFAPASRGALPAGRYIPETSGLWRLTGSDADARRSDALSRATVHFEHPHVSPAAVLTPTSDDVFDELPVVCRFLADEPTGTSPKFNCILDDGAVIKVKYNRNPEINAETAASSLLRRLGYAVDDVRIVPQLRDAMGARGIRSSRYSCSPRLALPRLLPPRGHDDAYTDYEWVSVESQFERPAIETEHQAGWAWYELESSRASRTDLDAFRLLALFLAHWDNKSANQRLVCLDNTPTSSTGICARPLLMMHDLGATFGPVKANLAEWSSRGIWTDRRTCLVSMRAFPFQGATFPDAHISETGRVHLGRRLAAIPDAEIRRLFLDAGFHRFYTATGDEQGRGGVDGGVPPPRRSNRQCRTLP